MTFPPPRSPPARTDGAPPTQRSRLRAGLAPTAFIPPPARLPAASKGPSDLRFSASLLKPRAKYLSPTFPMFLSPHFLSSPPPPPHLPKLSHFLKCLCYDLTELGVCSVSVGSRDFRGCFSGKRLPQKYPLFCILYTLRSPEKGRKQAKSKQSICFTPKLSPQPRCALFIAKPNRRPFSFPSPSKQGIYRNEKI